MSDTDAGFKFLVTRWSDHIKMDDGWNEFTITCETADLEEAHRRFDETVQEIEKEHGSASAAPGFPGHPDVNAFNHVLRRKCIRWVVGGGWVCTDYVVDLVECPANVSLTREMFHPDCWMEVRDFFVATGREKSEDQMPETTKPKPEEQPRDRGINPHTGRPIASLAELADLMVGNLVKSINSEAEDDEKK